MAKPAEAQPRGGGTSWRTWALIVAVVLAIIFVGINSKTVTVDFLFFDASMPLIFALLIAMVLGIVIGYFIAHSRASRRQSR